VSTAPAPGVARPPDIARKSMSICNMSAHGIGSRSGAGIVVLLGHRPARTDVP
jgi:hypothetical protein